MNNLKFIILITIVATGISTVAFSSLPPVTIGTIFKKHSEASDTSLLNRNIKEAFYHLSKANQGSLSSKEKDKEVLLIKSYIDTAEFICVERNLEFPSSLHLIRAEYFFYTNDVRSASQEATLAIKKAKNNNDAEVLAKTMYFLGRYSLRSGFFMESISYFENSISIAEKNKLKGLITRNLLTLKDVYDNLGNHEQYVATMYKLIDAASKENDTAFIMRAYYFFGTYMIEKQRNFKLSDSLLNRSLEVALIKKDTFFITLSLSNIGYNYYLEKNYNASIKSYNNSLVYSIPGKIYSNSANSLGNLGTIYRDLGEMDRSIDYYRKSIDQAKLMEDIYNLQWVYMDMSEMYIRKKDTANAYKSYVLFKKYSDQMLKENNTRGLADARIRYDADSHNQEVELLSLKLYNQRLMIYGSSGLFLLSLAVFILLLSRAKINAKRRMSEMNRKIAEVTQANLRQQMNPHFIFNTLNSIQYYMYQHDKLATNNYLTKFSSLMRKVLENSQHTSVPLRDELDALILYLELEMIRFKDKFEYQINIDEEIDTLLYKVPTMLIQPYVENSICHGLMPGESKGSLRIDLKLENEYILCTIEDNGIGREAAYERRKKSDNNHNSRGTQIVSSRLDLVNALYGTSLKTIYTDLINENGEPAGTRVEIQIPILS